MFLQQKTEVPDDTRFADFQTARQTDSFSARMQHTDVLTWHYVFCTGMYRAFYILNWAR